LSFSTFQKGESVAPASAAKRDQLVKQLQTFDSGEIYQKILELGQRNISSLLQTMSFDKDKDYHRLVTCFSPVQPISNLELAPLGPAAHPNFNVIPPAWQKHEDMLSFVAGEMAQNRSNFTIITNHSNIIDIALVLGGLRLEILKYLKFYGLDEMYFSQSSGIVISRGITTTQVSLSGLDYSMPTVEAIQLFSNVFYSFPTTTSVRNKGFPSELLKLSNELTKLEVDNFKSQGGTVMAIAPSASKDVFLRERVHMQPLKNGTMEMMMGWVIPVAITLDGNEPACDILPWRYVDSYEGCHATMHEIAKACHRQTLTPHDYHEKPSLFEEAKQGLNRLRKD
jgi:hypothetical protein